MVELLREAIRTLQLDAREVADAVALRSQLDAHIALAAGELDAAKLWELDGEGSLASWLRSHARMSAGGAAHLSKMAQRMRQHPVTAEAWRDGGLSTGQVDTIERAVQRKAVVLFAEHEPEVVPHLVGLSAVDTLVAMSEWASRAEAVLDGSEPDDGEGEVFCTRIADGRGALKGNLDPECRALVEAALRVAATKDAEDETKRTLGRIRHDALADVCKFYLDNQTSRAGGSFRPHLNVIIRHEDLAAGRGGRDADGGLVDAVTMSAIRCDCNIHTVLVDAQNAKIDYGRETKTISPELRTALIVRDGRCRFLNCDRPVTYCDGHHVQWWRHGGPTNLENIVLLCRGHHRTLHKRGWEGKLLPDGTFTVTAPDGTTRTTRPPGFDTKDTA